MRQFTIDFLREQVFRLIATTDNQLSSEALQEQVEKKFQASTQSMQIPEELLQTFRESGGVGTAISLFGEMTNYALSSGSQLVESFQAKRILIRQQRQAAYTQIALPEVDDCSNRQRVIYELFQFLDQFSDKQKRIKRLSGVQYIGSSHSVKIYLVPAYYQVHTSDTDNLSNINPIDRCKKDLHTLIRVGLNDVIHSLSLELSQESWFWGFCKSLYYGDAYVANTLMPWVVLRAVTNVFWMLLYPIDIDTGRPLSTDENVLLCEDVLHFITTILAPDLPPMLGKEEDADWVQYLKTAELLVDNLKEAYIEESYHYFPIDDIAVQAREMAKDTARALFELIYAEPVTTNSMMEKRPQIADRLELKVSTLQVYFEQYHPQITVYFSLSDASWDDESNLLNLKQPKTLLDLLAAFLRLTASPQKKQLLHALQRDDLAPIRDFGRTLESFNEQFIEPMVLRIKTYPDGGSACASINASEIMLKRFTPCLCLLMDAFNTTVDDNTASQIRHILNHNYKYHVSEDLSAEQPFLFWDLSPLLGKYKKHALKLNFLPMQLHRMSMIAFLQESLAALIQKNESILQYRFMQNFTKKSIEKIRAALDDFLMTFGRAQNSLSEEESISRKMRCLLFGMTRKLNNSLKSFSEACVSAQHMISKSNFSIKSYRSLKDRLSFIAEIYKDLFREDSGLESILSSSNHNIQPGIIQGQFNFFIPHTQRIVRDPRSHHSNTIQDLQYLTMVTAIDKCYLAMSVWSKWSKKGKLMLALKARLESDWDDNISLSDIKIKNHLISLIKIAASYHKTCFFQADYGKTRTAKALISFFKNEHMNAVLPIAQILFGETAEAFQQYQDEVIAARLETLRAQNQWTSVETELTLAELNYSRA